MTQLRRAGLVESDRRGMNVYHRPHRDAIGALCTVLDPNCCTSFAQRGFRHRASSFSCLVVATVSEAAEVGHVLATDAVVVDTDTLGVQVQWSENSNADDFSKNLIRARCEDRFNTSVYSPLGVVTADLTA